MEEESKKRLKKFWRRKGLLWVGTIVTMSATIATGLVTIGLIGLAISATIGSMVSIAYLYTQRRDEIDSMVLIVYRLYTKRREIEINKASKEINEASKTVLPGLRQDLKDLDPYVRLLFPEETVAEFTALRKRRFQQRRPLWKIRLELTYEILLLLWACYIQIPFENRWLPPSKKRNIDD